jgi:hypothetical protein
MNATTSRRAGHEPGPSPIRGVGLSMPQWARSSADLPSGAMSTEDVSSTASSVSMWALACEFPTVPWALMGLPPRDALVIPETAWRRASGFQRWDEAMSGLVDQPRWLVVEADDSRTLHQTAREVLTRYQRLVPRTNAASAGLGFREILSGHRALHDLGLPLVKADYDHALDVWQWVLRLAPTAGLAVQLAALFHDIERLVSEAERRIEHNAVDYQAFKNAHAEQGAKMADEVLCACGVDASTRREVARLICEHERPHAAGRDGDLALLADADSLSFFSLNSPGFVDYYGSEHTRKKVRYSLGRMSSRAVRALSGVRLREDVARYLVETARAETRVTLDRVDDRLCLLNGAVASGGAVDGGVSR